MLESIISKIEELMQVARDYYCVNPIIFLIIYLGCAPLFYYSIFRTLRALGRRLAREAMIWSAVFLASTAAPFIYVLFFGRNIPWWAYGIIALLIAQALLAFAVRLRRNTAGGEETGAK
jgi:hypothetical protein